MRFYSTPKNGVIHLNMLPYNALRYIRKSEVVMI